jgi:uncharacterized membrane protein HdeD (DUF308 family)
MEHPMVSPLQSSEAAPRFGLVDFGHVRDARAWFIGLGVAFMVLGGLAILLPFLASLVTALVIGWLLIVGGVIQGVHALQNRRWGHSGWAIAGAILHVIAGALVVVFPVAGTAALALILASFLIASGAIKIIRAAQHRAMPAWGWLVLDGILSLVLGIMIWIGWPSTAVWAVGLLVGIDLVFSGSSMLLIGIGAGARAPAAR